MAAFYSVLLKRPRSDLSMKQSGFQDIHSRYFFKNQAKHALDFKYEPCHIKVYTFHSNNMCLFDITPVSSWKYLLKRCIACSLSLTPLQFVLIQVNTINKAFGYQVGITACAIKVQFSQLRNFLSIDLCLQDWTLQTGVDHRHCRLRENYYCSDAPFVSNQFICLLTAYAAYLFQAICPAHVKELILMLRLGIYYGTISLCVQHTLQENVRYDVKLRFSFKPFYFRCGFILGSSFRQDTIYTII